MIGIKVEPDAVALLNSVSRELLVISERFPRFTRTALDVGGPCVGAFG